MIQTMLRTEVESLEKLLKSAEQSAPDLWMTIRRSVAIAETTGKSGVTNKETLVRTTSSTDTADAYCVEDEQ